MHAHGERPGPAARFARSLLLLEHVFQDEIGQLNDKRAEPCIFLKQRYQFGVHVGIEAIVLTSRWRRATKLISS
jgi:hypothetical protein